MENQPAVPLSVSALRVVSHKVIVKGVYNARAFVRGPSGGTPERRSVEYRESFDLPLAPHHHDAHQAMAAVLSKLLPERLLAKDKEFRGINTHHVAGHENVKEDPTVRDARVKAWLDAEDAKKTK